MLRLINKLLKLFNKLVIHINNLLLNVIRKKPFQLKLKHSYHYILIGKNKSYLIKLFLSLKAITWLNPTNQLLQKSCLGKKKLKLFKIFIPKVYIWEKYKKKTEKS